MHYRADMKLLIVQIHSASYDYLSTYVLYHTMIVIVIVIFILQQREIYTNIISK